MEGIDKMTMELLMNKRKYNKYISKADPDKYEKRQQEFAKMQRYASRIMHLTEDLLNDPNMEVQNDVNEAFLQYVKTCMYHFENKDLELAGCKDYYEHDDEDDDVMFDKCDSANATANTTATGSSYWGKSIQKVGNSRVDAFFQPKKI